MRFGKPMWNGMPMRPALRYHGGKWLLAPWIISNFRPHRVYTEVFGGGASVLIQKERSYAEIYNDLNGEIVNLFRVLQDIRMAERLQRKVRLTPFARMEFKLAYEPAATGSPADRMVEDARRLLIRAFMGFGSAAHNSRHATGFRCSSDRSGTTPAQDWKNYPDAMWALVARMQGVCIEQKDALELLGQRDGRDYLHYIDPPYVHVTRQHRQHGNYGKFEMTDADHCRLAEVLKGLKGSVALSGYDSVLYRKLYRDWSRKEKRTFGNSNRGAVPRKEILWMNY